MPSPVPVKIRIKKKTIIPAIVDSIDAAPTICGMSGRAFVYGILH